MLQRVVFGPVTNPENERLFDLNSRELGLLLPLLFLMLFMGVYPRVFLDRSEGAESFAFALRHLQAARTRLRRDLQYRRGSSGRTVASEPEHRVLRPRR